MPGAFTPDMLLAIQAQLAGLGFAQQGQPGGMMPPQMAFPHLVPPMSHGGQSSLTSSPANYQSTISITLPMLTDTVMGMTTSPVYPSAAKSAQVQPTLTPASNIAPAFERRVHIFPDLAQFPLIKLFLSLSLLPAHPLFLLSCPFRRTL